MGFEEEVNWLRNCRMQYPPVVEGDNLGTTFLSTGAVLLVAAMDGTQSAVLIALLTGLPKRFVGLIVHSLDRMELRRFRGFRDLERKIKLDMTIRRSKTYYDGRSSHSGWRPTRNAPSEFSKRSATASWSVVSGKTGSTKMSYRHSWRTLRGGESES
jgi:hypothetical protein